MADENSGSRRESSRNGFSLCETMVAAAVLAVSLLGLAQLLGVAFVQGQMSRYNSIAVELGQGKIEQLRQIYTRELSEGIAHTDLTEGEHGPETVILTNGDGTYTNHRMNLRWRVDAVGPVRKNLEVFVLPTALASNAESSKAQANRITLKTVLLP